MPSKAPLLIFFPASLIISLNLAIEALRILSTSGCVISSLAASFAGPHSAAEDEAAGGLLSRAAGCVFSALAASFPGRALPGRVFFFWAKIEPRQSYAVFAAGLFS